MFSAQDIFILLFFSGFILLSILALVVWFISYLCREYLKEENDIEEDHY